MKPDELEFLRVYFESLRGRAPLPTPRELIAKGSMPKKRAWYLLEKWERKGWYDFGVSLDLGWLTEKGVEEIGALLAKEGA